MDAIDDARIVVPGAALVRIARVTVLRGAKCRHFGARNTHDDAERAGRRRERPKDTTIAHRRRQSRRRGRGEAERERASAAQS